MIKRRRCVRFLIEPASAIAILREFLSKEFERNFAAQTSVLGEVNFTHSPGAELFENPITRDRLQFFLGGLVHFNCNGARALAVTPFRRITLFLELVPEIISTAFCGTFNLSANTRTSSRLAAPSTGGAAIRIRKPPSCSPTISLDDARGTIRTVKVIPRSSWLN